MIQVWVLTESHSGSLERSSGVSSALCALLPRAVTGNPRLSINSASSHSFHVGVYSKVSAGAAAEPHSAGPVVIVCCDLAVCFRAVGGAHGCVRCVLQSRGPGHVPAAGGGAGAQLGAAVPVPAALLPPPAPGPHPAALQTRHPAGASRGSSAAEPAKTAPLKA